MILDAPAADVPPSGHVPDGSSLSPPGQISPSLHCSHVGFAVFCPVATYPALQLILYVHVGYSSPFQNSLLLTLDVVPFLPLSSNAGQVTKHCSYSVAPVVLVVPSPGHFSLHPGVPILADPVPGHTYPTGQST